MPREPPNPIAEHKRLAAPALKSVAAQRGAFRERWSTSASFNRQRLDHKRLASVPVPKTAAATLERMPAVLVPIDEIRGSGRNARIDMDRARWDRPAGTDVSHSEWLESRSPS